MSRDNPPEVKEALRRRTPANRQGSAEEVAAVIVFLAGPGADFVNGQVLAVDGGWSIKG
jgi:NAD(P)-dependent dehydrogenase (short-subunit alcohol dehydrogenase family)